MQTGQQEFADGSFACQRGLGKELEGILTQASSLEISAFLIENQRLVEVDEGRPDPVLLASEKFACLAKQFECAKGLALMAGSGGKIRHCLSCLVPHTEFFEAGKSLLGKLRSLFAQVELQIDFRLVQIAQRLVIAVAQFFALFARSSIQLNRSRRFAAQVVEISNVVVSLKYEQRHALLLAVGPGFLIGFQCPRKIIQADVADGQIAECDGSILRFALGTEFVKGTLIEFECLFKAILAIKDIAQVAIETRQSQPVPVSFENLPSVRSAFEGFVILAQINEGLQRTAERDRGIKLPS